MSTFKFILTNLNTSETKTLSALPADWESFTKNLTRSDIYHGILETYSLNLSFQNVGGNLFDYGGYWFLKSAYDTDGINALIKVERQYKNPYTQAYESNFIGIIEFTHTSGFKINITENIIDCKITESSKVRSFLANHDKNFSLSSQETINGTAVTPFSNHPIQALFSSIPIYLYAYTSGNLDKNSVYTADTTETIPYTYSASVNYLGDRLVSVDQTVYENTTGDDVDVTYQMLGDYRNFYTLRPLNATNHCNIDQEVLYEIRNSSGGLIGTIVIFSESGYYENIATNIYIDKTNTINKGQTYNVPAGGYIRVFNRIAIGAMLNMRIELQSRFTIDEFNLTEFYPGSSLDYSTVWYPFELTSRMIQLMTNETDTNKLLDSEVFGRTDSEYYPYGVDGIFSRIATVGGKVLRKLQNAKTTINFKDWFESVSKMCGLALWYDKVVDRFRIEGIENVYKDELIIDLGTVSNINIIPATHYSKLLTGTEEKGDYEKIQGIQEYNIQSEHSIDFPVSDALNLRPKYNTDSIGIEFQRRAITGEEAEKDSKGDDKVYLVECNAANNVITNDDIGGFSGFFGIGDRYNGNYTPRKCIINNGKILAGYFEKIAGGKIRFRSNAKDLDIIYSGINEQNDILASELGTALFYPEYHEIDFEINYDEAQIIFNNFHGYLKYNDINGNIYYGYIEELEINEYKGIGSAKLKKANINR